MSVKRWNGTGWDTYAGGQTPLNQIIIWKKTAAGGETSLSGNDDNLLSLAYTIGQEMLFINGVLQVRNVDYTATTGTSITGISALIAGDTVQVWCPSVYQVPSASATASQWRYIAVGGETTLTGLDSVSTNLTYTVGQELVFQNGNLLYRGTDYTATNGTSVVLTNALVASDVINVWSPNAFTVANSIPTTTIASKGDLIVGTSASNFTNLGVGANDQILVADNTAGSGVAWKSYGAQGMAGKNAVINGGFDIWQRGTTNVTTSLAYTADRWKKSTITAYGVSRQATGDTTNLPNIQYCARVQRTAASTSTTIQELEQSFETVNSIPLAGKTVTLSFYARAGANYSSSGNTITAQLYTSTGTDGELFTSWPSPAVPLNATFTLTTTWQRFSVTGLVSSSATQVSPYFFYIPTGTAGANDYFEITGVQLELGSTATPFSRAGGSIGGELALCQRYYYRINAEGVNGGTMMVSGQSQTTSGCQINHPNPVKMRAIPTVSFTAGNLAVQQSNGSRTGVSSFQQYNTSSNIQLFVTTSTANLTVGNGNALVDFNSGNSFVEVSAEL